MSITNKSITLSDGKEFRFLRPGEYDFNIKVMARALSKICRFGGQCSKFYSVAQHSVLVSTLVPPAYAGEALLHDAAEAFVGDMTTPLKQLIPEFRAIEQSIDEAIRECYGLPLHESIHVKNADTVAFVTERRDFMPPVSCTDPLQNIPRLDDVIVPLGPDAACELFMDRYREIVGWRA